MKCLFLAGFLLVAIPRFAQVTASSLAALQGDLIDATHAARLTLAGELMASIAHEIKQIVELHGGLIKVTSRAGEVRDLHTARPS